MLKKNDGHGTENWLSKDDLASRLLDIFDFIQIINLKSRPDRLRQIQRELARIGLSLTSPNVSVLEASRFEESAGFDTAGTRGCFVSHLRALRTAADRNSKATLILEDDCGFPRDILGRAWSALDALSREDWSIFYGGHSGLQGNSSKSPLIQVGSARPIITAHCVAFSSDIIPGLVSFLEAMLERPPGSSEGGPMHVDGAYNWFRNNNPEIRVLAAVPELAYQRPSRTDIGPLQGIDRIPILRGLSSTARQIWYSLRRQPVS